MSENKEKREAALEEFRAFIKYLAKKGFTVQQLKIIEMNAPAVSYTHLDVYKRQGGGCRIYSGGKNTVLPICPGGPPVSLQLFKQGLTARIPCREAASFDGTAA